jgi:hypothetical protein
VAICRISAWVISLRVTRGVTLPVPSGRRFDTPPGFLAGGRFFPIRIASSGHGLTVFRWREQSSAHLLPRPEAEGTKPR